MNFVIVLIKGIIKNIFIIKIKISYSKLPIPSFQILKMEGEGEGGREGEDEKETLKRAGKLLIITKIIKKGQIIKNKNGKEYSIKDGLILIKEGRLIL